MIPYKQNVSRYLIKMRERALNTFNYKVKAILTPLDLVIFII